MDQLREDSRERNWEDYVEDAGAVLAIGAGAAYFLKKGGTKRLNRLSEYILGARRAYAEGAFEENIFKGFSEAKKIALAERGHIAKNDLSRQGIWQSLFAGADIRAGGRTKDRLVGGFEQNFQLKYGKALYNEMLGSAEHMDREQAGILRNMLSDFTAGEAVPEMAIRARIQRLFGENASDQAIAEAERFANELQAKMRDTGITKQIRDAQTDLSKELSVAVEKFKGFDPATGQAQWDAADIIERIEAKNPTRLVEEAGDAALDLLKALEAQEEKYGSYTEQALSSVLGNRVTFGEVEEAIARGELSKDAFSSRLYQLSQGTEASLTNTFDAMLDIRQKHFGDQAAEFNKLIVEGLRRGEDGKIYSTAALDEAIGLGAESLAGTLPGKMLRVTEYLYNRQQPMFEVFREGTLDYFLSKALGNSRYEMETIQDVMRIHGRFYIHDGNVWKESAALRDYTLMPNKVGSSRDFLQGMRDAERARLRGQTRYLDGFQNLSKGEIKELSEEYGNQFDFMLGEGDPSRFVIGIADIAAGRAEGRNVINRTRQWYHTEERFAHLQNELRAADLANLKAGLQAYKDRIPASAFETLEFAEKIVRDPTDASAIEFASQIGTKDRPGNFFNVELNHLISDFKKNQERTIRQTITRVDQTKKSAGSVHFYSQNFRENLAQELIQETFLRIRGGTVDKTTGLVTGESRDAAALIEDIINSRFKGTKASNLKSFAAAGMFNSRTHYKVYGIGEDEIAKNTLGAMLDIRSGNTAEDRFIFNSFQELKTRFNFKGERKGFSATAEAWDKTGDWAVIHKNYGMDSLRMAMQMVRNANDKERGRAIINAAFEAAKPITQFFSGADKLGAPSSASVLGYRVMNLVDSQLNREFNLLGRHIKIKFGLDKQDKGSAGSILANLVTKRVFPVAAAITYLDFMDDTARAVLGQGLGEAGLSGLANSYLAVKKITGATGLDSALKGITSDSPMARYFADYTGDINPEWKSYEEQKDYYERGYTPIRKARFWNFGSSNEYRGGRISYFEPNTLRMMRSNYYMESMYEGSMWTKWSHSLLPTPLNPLSPINYMLDPYYLENLHKEDRPYPVTGSTFAENTPWGVVLNPVFDTFIKPRKEMYRDRLGEDGVDIKALIAHINDDIRRRTNNRQNGDIIYLQNGKLRSMLFTAFNAPTPSERVVGQQGASITASTEYGEYGAGIEAGEYPQLAESNADQAQDMASAGLTIGMPAQAGKLSVSDRLVISSAKGNAAAGMLVDTMKATGVFDALRGANIKIREQGMLRKDQGFFYENKMQYESSSLDEMLANSETISDLMTQGKGHDYVHEMAVSARMVTGLYGYMASLAFGIGSNNQKKIATSANMESAGRSFWDLGIGGFSGGEYGGDIMEIARRFIPEYHRMQQVNPLMNTMPDWLPERLRFGDPYAALPKGEARLPGRGYESLNQLHPDIYGRYGAFDRFKILADVAPYSPEYKFWKKVAGATIQDPELKKEIQEIKDRVAEQTKGHDFYDYKYIGRGMEQQNAVVSEVLNFGKFKIVGSEQVYKLSGVKIAGNPDETTKDVLSRYLLPGQEITLYTDENPAYARNNDKDQTINAGVMVTGENIAEQMLHAGDAKVRKGDMSSTAYMLNHGVLVNGLNTLQEFIGHANIPIIHSRFLNMNSPLEAYKDDNVYGTSFQSWSDIWGTFIRPAFQIGSSNPYGFSAGILANIINNNVQNEGKEGVRNLIREALENSQFIKAIGKEEAIKGPASEGIRKWAARGAYFLDRGALVGHFAGRTWFMGSSKSLAKSQEWQKLGATASVAAAAVMNPDNLAVSTIAWSRLGYQFANEYLKKNRLAATVAGAAIGAASWAAAQKILADDDLANTYIPDATRKKWEMQEYFDRLTYIKYRGLFEQAADMALEKEGIDIRAILASQEREQKELREQKEKLGSDLRALDHQHTAEAEEAKKLIRKTMNQMHGVKLGIRGGEFTKSAIMYKNAADATMYGLDENAMMADIVRALPKTERDYFIEFMKEKDKEKREEILKTVSPMLNRALRTIWKMPLPEKVSNEEYFEHHTLPAPTWAGWRPDIDLANVEAKVIYNQGMQFSDMGIYASQYREPEVQNAPNIEYNTSQNSMLLTRLKLQMALTGTGLDASKVSVEPSQDSGIQVVANVARVIPYKINEEFERLFSF